MPAPPALGVYVHLPWCIRKCPYCDFNSHELRGAAPFAAYVDALLEDLDADLPLVTGREVATVFFGGGTPSLCPPPLIDRFLAGLAARLRLAADVEITLEANPGAIEHGRFSELAGAGINRVSLGVQSFQPRLLRAIGRIHDDREACAAIDELARAGIANFNLDLMFGLPGQGAADAAADVAAAIAAQPPHLSLYQLTLEPGTPFFRRPPRLPDDEACWEMESAATVQLEAAGYRRYEVSAWAQPGRECRHNLNYWSFGDYLGLGAGAHGKLTLADGAIMRRQRRRRPLGWLEGPRIEAEHLLTAEERLFEFMLNALRLADGFSLADFEARTGLAAAAALPGLERGHKLGLLAPRGESRWQPTALGQRFLNDAQALFLPTAGR
ncbi:MAG: radical SAM family heme chaperone HemW [Gammaproteobacteria bacterium]